MGVPVSNCCAPAYYPSQRLVTHKLHQSCVRTDLSAVNDCILRFKYSSTPAFAPLSPDPVVGPHEIGHALVAKRGRVAADMVAAAGLDLNTVLCPLQVLADALHRYGAFGDRTRHRFHRVRAEV